MLTGAIVSRDITRAVLDVRGVGYEVHATQSALLQWPNDEQVVVHISTQVREDSITLYGFPSPDDRRAFEVLIAVSGVGPKMAMSCLDSMPLDKLRAAIEADDITALTRIKGVGKKTAQRMALELKSKLPAAFGPVDPSATAATPRRAQGPDPMALALQKLGYSKGEIDRAAQALLASGVPESAPVGERLRAALQALYRNPS